MFRYLLKNVRQARYLAAAVALAGGALACQSDTLSLSFSKPIQAAGYNYARRYYPAPAEYPDVKKHRNMMARCLTKGIYAKLRDQRTKNGFTIDDAIQTGVDNVGLYSFTGIVAGDEESYAVFRELFDKIIELKHQFKPFIDKHRKDINYSSLKNGLFDSDYVLSIRIRAFRNLRGFCLPPFCTRGERRDVESILLKTLTNMSTYDGIYFSLPELSKEEEEHLTQV